MLQNLALQNGLQNLATIKGSLINMYQRHECTAATTDLNAPAASATSPASS